MSLVEQFFESQHSSRRIIQSIARRARVDEMQVESDTLLRLMRQPDSVAFAAALRTAARCAAIDLIRQRQRQPVESLSETRQNDAGDTHSTTKEPGAVDMTETRMLARVALQTLTRGERRAILSHAADASARVMRSKAKAKIEKFFASR